MRWDGVTLHVYVYGASNGDISLQSALAWEGNNDVTKCRDVIDLLTGTQANRCLQIEQKSDLVWKLWWSNREKQIMCIILFYVI